MKLSRRACLRALGATLALPFLDSLAWAEEPGRRDPTRPPKRWALLLFANGVNVHEWWVKGVGAQMQLSSSLKPLEPFRGDISFVQNMHIFDNTVGVHTPYFTNFLCGVPLADGSIPHLAQSCDQALARAIGQDTPVPSLVLGTKPANYGLAGGKPAIYGSTMSWASPTTPVGPTIHPRRVFDRLFDVKGLERDRSVLDVVLKQGRDLRGRLAVHDQHKLDEYLESVREIEVRIDRATNPPEPAAGEWRPGLAQPDLERPQDGIPGSFPEHVKLMLDLMILAFRMDKTRVATFLFEDDISGQTFDFIEGVSKTGMHTLSHHQKKPSMLAEYQKINRWHVEQLAYVLDRLRSIDEGGATLLDSSMLLFGSTMMDGDFHDANDLPLILCGRGGGTLSPGKVLRPEKLEERRLCNLHLALMQKMGMPIDRFGNSPQVLAGL